MHKNCDSFPLSTFLKTKAGRMRHSITPDSYMWSLRKRRRAKQSHTTNTPIQMEATAPSNPDCQVAAHLVKSPVPADDQDPKN